DPADAGTERQRRGGHPDQGTGLHAGVSPPEQSHAGSGEKPPDRDQEAGVWQSRPLSPLLLAGARRVRIDGQLPDGGQSGAQGCRRRRRGLRPRPRNERPDQGQGRGQIETAVGLLRQSSSGSSSSPSRIATSMAHKPQNSVMSRASSSGSMSPA